MRVLRRGLDRSELDRIGSVWQAPGFVATLVSVFCAFGGWALLMPVVPLEVIRAGGSDGAAGLATGAFMASTVLTQAVTPRVLRRVGYFPVMCGAGLFLGLPALVHLLSLDPVTVLVVAVVRGVGFGSVTVAESALLAELVPARLLGRSSGIFGAVIGVAELVGFPLGVQLGGAVWVVAAAVSVVGAVAALWVPLIRPAPRET
ncbi:MFS transporter, partial [Corynebacterium bovis]